MDSAGSDKGGLPGAAPAEKSPEQERGSSTLKDEQDEDQELGSGKSFQQNKRTSDSYNVLNSVVGFSKAQSARTCGCPFSPINSCQFFTYKFKVDVHRGMEASSAPRIS